MTFTLMPHQEEALRRGRERNQLLAHGCGTGKTLTAIQLIDYHRSKDRGTAMVMCPSSIIDDAWMEDLTNFAPHLSYEILAGQSKAKRAKLLKSKADIFLINPESVVGTLGELAAKNFGIAVIDESSKLKNYDSQITHAMLAFAGINSTAKIGGRRVHVKLPASCRPVPWRYCLSGTPAPNDQLEYYSQLKFVAGPRKCFSDNYYSFRGEYGWSQNIGPHIKTWKFRKKMLPKLLERMRPWTHVVSKEDALPDLPPQMPPQIRRVRLSAKEMAVYDEMQKDFLANIDGQTIMASNAAAKTMKLRQAVGGFLYNESKAAVQIQRMPSKLSELRDVLDEIGDQQCVIWYTFDEERDMILASIDSCRWAGKIGNERTGNVADFKAGKFQRLVCNPQSVAHGVRLTNCHYAVYYSLTYSYEYTEQSQDRLHRNGQLHNCTYYYLVARNTTDEVIMDCIRGKRDASNEVLQFLRRKAAA